MRLTINGEPAQLFFRHLRTAVDKFEETRSDALKLLGKKLDETATPAQALELSAALDVVVAQLPPNVTEAWLTLGEKMPVKGKEREQRVIAYGRVWHHPRDRYDPELARKYALASAMEKTIPRPARKKIWEFYRRRKEWQTKALADAVFDVVTVIPQPTPRPSQAPWKKKKQVDVGPWHLPAYDPGVPADSKAIAAPRGKPAKAAAAKGATRGKRASTK